MQRKVCHNCQDRQPEGACRKTCEKWQEEQRLWDEEMEKRKARCQGNYFSRNAQACRNRKARGH